MSDTPDIVKALGKITLVTWVIIVLCGIVYWSVVEGAEPEIEPPSGPDRWCAREEPERPIAGSSYRGPDGRFYILCVPEGRSEKPNREEADALCQEWFGKVFAHRSTTGEWWCEPAPPKPVA